jgi:hypothetical protein
MRQLNEQRKTFVALMMLYSWVLGKDQDPAKRLGAESTALE